MKKTALYASAILLLSMAACKTHKKTEATPKMPEPITTASGLKVQIVKQGSGPLAQKGNKVSVHYTGKLTNDTVFDSSYRRNKPFTFKLGSGQVIKGWDEGIALLHVGDKAIFTIPPELGYGPRGSGSAIPPNSTLIFEVELMEAIDASPKPYDVKGLDTVTTNTGLKYIKVKTVENGTAPIKGKQVSVHYTGYLPDGSIFDSSIERGEPIAFELGIGRVIPGWDEGIALLKIGEKARLIIPPALGYGDRGYPPIIPEKATLIFDVELVSAAPGN